MRKISLKSKAAIFISIALLIFVAFSIAISFVFYSDAVKLSGVSDAVSSKTQFFIIFTCAEILVAMIIIVLFVYLTGVCVAKPVENLAKVVGGLVYDDELGKETYDSEDTKKKLKDLEISTGDEIEVLYHSLQKMQMDLNEYIVGMREDTWEEEHDNMTMLSNRNKYEKRKKEVYPYVDSIYIACLDIINLRQVNEKLSTEAGDSIITKVARELRRLSSDNIHTYRLEEDNFLIVFCGYTEDEATQILNKWNERVGRLNRATDSFECKLCWGGSYGENDFVVEDIFKRADAEMYCQQMVMKNELGSI